jgi:2'-5' RNA ligase
LQYKLNKKLEKYEKLWNEAVAAFDQGEPRIDSHLLNKAQDLRRSVVLVYRPSALVQGALVEYIERLKQVCPEQYFYRPEELHLTIMAIFSGTEQWQKEMERVPKCQQILQELLKLQSPFKVKFRSVTASQDSVMVRALPLDDSLEVIRNAIREVFVRNGLGDMLDRRYKAFGAHVTIMRFSKPCPNSKRLLEFLKGTRETDFGKCEVSTLELNWADWYASAETARTLEKYQLR